MSNIQIIRGTTPLPANLTNTIVTDVATMSSPGNYRIGSWVYDLSLKGFENEIVNYNGTSYSTYVRNEGDTILTNSEEYQYDAVSGWIRKGSFTSTSSSGGTGTSGITQAEAQAAFTAALASQNQIEFQDTQLVDSDNVLFFRNKAVDEETGAITITNVLPNGTAYVPVGAVSAPGKNDLQNIKENTAFKWAHDTYYRVMVGDGLSTTTGDYVVCHKKYDANDIAATEWYNITSGMNEISQPNQIDLKLWNRLVDDAVNKTENHTAVTAAYSPFHSVTESVFYAKVPGSGYSIGDRLIRVNLVSGVVAWYNTDSISGGAISAPSLTNLTRNISEPNITTTLTTLPNTVDNPYFVGAGVRSAVIAVPNIGNKKANRVTLVRTAATNSPLYPTENGSLYVETIDGQLEIVPTSGLRRPLQMTIPAANTISSTAFLNKDAASISVRNWNLGTTTYSVRFWYSEVDELQSYSLHAYAQSSISSTVTGAISSPTHTLTFRFDTLRLLVQTTTQVGNATFELQVLSTLPGNVFVSIGQIVIPAGATFGYVEIPYSQTGASFRILPVNTNVASYSYRVNVNK